MSESDGYGFSDGNGTGYGSGPVAKGYIHLPEHAIVRAGDEIRHGPPGRMDWEPARELHVGQRAGFTFRVRRRIRPAPFVGYRWCECGDPIDGHADERVGSLNVFVCRDSMHPRAGGAPSGINGHGYVTRWTADPRLLENRSGATQPSSQMHLVPGVGISAPTKEDPALVVDEQWGEEFER